VIIPYVRFPWQGGLTEVAETARMATVKKKSRKASFPWKKIITLELEIGIHIF
jgi:hypothetical protein